MASASSDEQFHYNLMLAKALVQLMAASDRQYIKIWFDALVELEETEQDKLIRDEYMWFVLLMLQNGKIEDHFKKIPPRKILPLKKVVPENIIEDVLLATDQNMSWLEGITEDDKKNELKNKKVPPPEFFSRQPLPKDGVICYFGAFSDQSL